MASRESGSTTLANGSAATFAQALGMGDSIAKQSLTTQRNTEKNTEKAADELGKVVEGIGKMAQKAGLKFSS